MPRSLLLSLLAIFLVNLLLRLLPGPFDGVLNWDEHYYIPESLHILRHQPLMADHPPGGKFLLSLGYRLGALRGSRMVAMIAGSFLPILVALITFRLSNRQRAALLSAALISLDPYLLAESRLALLNPLLYMSFLGTLLVALSPKRWLRCCLSGLGMGLTLGIKWTVAPFLPIVLGLQRRWQAALVCLLLIVFSYALVFAPVGKLQPSTFLKAHQAILSYHQNTRGFISNPKQVVLSNLGPGNRDAIEVRHQLEKQTLYGQVIAWVNRWQPEQRFDSSKPALFWPLGSFEFYASRPKGDVLQVLAAIANPALWLGCTIAGLRQLTQPSNRWLGWAFLLGWVPWVIIQRPLYAYTFIPAVLVGVICLGLQLDQGLRQGAPITKRLLWGYVALCAVYFACYAPFSLGYGMV